MPTVPVNATILGSTIVFAPYSLEQALEGLAAAGYRNCEIGAVKGWFEHIDPDTATDKEIEFARSKLRGSRSHSGQPQRPHPIADRRGQGALPPRDRYRPGLGMAGRQYLHRRRRVGDRTGGLFRQCPATFATTRPDTV